jgi:MFS family permease
VEFCSYLIARNGVERTDRSATLTYHSWLSLPLALFCSAKLVNRYGIKVTFATGMLLGTLGLLFFSTTPLEGSLLTSVVPGMALLGIASGVSFNPLLLAATNGVRAGDSGVAAGLLGTSFVMGGAVGLAIIASASEAWTRRLTQAGVESLAALNSGYHLAFTLGALLALTAA